MTHRLTRLTSALLASVIFSTAPYVAAQQVLEEIVVTARKRVQNIQDVSMSITAFSGDQIEELGIRNLQNVSWSIPGLYATGARGDEDPLYTVRGIGLNDAFNNNNPTVGVYLNEVIQPFSPMMAFQLFDIERVEVLKGPQGTLYGRNTTGGAVNVFSKRPGEELNGYARVGYGEFQRFELEGAIGGPISDTVGGRIAAFTIQGGEGWLRNAFNGQKIGELDQTAVRGTLEWTPNEDLEFLPTTNLTARERSMSASWMAPLAQISVRLLSKAAATRVSASASWVIPIRPATDIRLITVLCTGKTSMAKT